MLQTTRPTPIISLLLLLNIFLMHYSLQAQDCFATRLYMHTDKATYLSGESIFFKAYIYTQFAPDEAATILDVALIDPAGNIRATGIYPIARGVSYGSLQIPDSLIQQGYLLRAFIRESGNATNTAVGFSKPVFVFNPTKPTANKNAALAAILGLNKVYVFPNSGKLIAGIPNQLYIHSTTSGGIPIPINCELLDAAKQLIQTFTIDAEGGFVNFIPQSGIKYHLQVRFPENKSSVFALDEVVENKVAIRVSESDQKAQIQVLIPQALGNNQPATLSGFIEDKKIFTKVFKLNSSGFFISLPVADLPAAVLNLVVQDGAGKMLGYYSHLINAQEATAAVELKIDSLNFTPGGMNVFSVKMKDIQEPNGNLSISVIRDDGIASIPAPTIQGALLLPVEPGNISQQHTSPHFFNKEQAVISYINRTQQPLVPLDSVGKVLPENCTHADSNIISVRGTVINKKTNQPINGGELKIIFSNQDSGMNVILTPIDAAGRFEMKKLLFQGLGRFRYEMNSKSSAQIKVLLDTSTSLEPMPVDPAVFYPLYSFVYADSLLQQKAVEQFNQQNTLSNNTLEEVIVESKIVRPFEKVNKKYTKGLFQNSVMSKNLDFINDPPPATGVNILDYLQGMINGLQISNMGAGNYSITSNRMTSFSGPAQVVVFLDEQMTTPNFLLGIPVREVALVKYYAPGTHQLVSGQFVGALCIYTKKWDDYPETDRPNNQSFVVKGFYNSLPAQSVLPVKAMVGKDSRSTLYWNPQIFIDNSQPSATIRFPNSATAESFLIRIEGFTPEGKLIHLEKRVSR
ncbi:MAG: hypothetical protein WCH59_02520 [Chitinophagia bacterium]|jgi:hypothetical protein